LAGELNLDVAQLPRLGFDQRAASIGTIMCFSNGYVAKFRDEQAGPWKKAGVHPAIDWTELPGTIWARWCADGGRDAERDAGCGAERLGGATRYERSERRDDPSWEL
jgi:hypothetical protein